MLLLNHALVRMKSAVFLTRLRFDDSTGGAQPLVMMRHGHDMYIRPSIVHVVAHWHILRAVLAADPHHV